MEQIIKIEHEKLDTEEGESNKDEEESSTSTKESKSTEISVENSTSAIPTETTEDSKLSEIPQVTNVLNKSTHDKPDSPKDKHVTESEQPKENGEHNIGKENKLLSTNFQVIIENQLKGS